MLGLDGCSSDFIVPGDVVACKKVVCELCEPDVTCTSWSEDNILFTVFSLLVVLLRLKSFSGPYRGLNL